MIIHGDMSIQPLVATTRLGHSSYFLPVISETDFNVTFDVRYNLSFGILQWGISAVSFHHLKTFQVGVNQWKKPFIL